MHTLQVMYLGHVVELGPTDRVYANPLHPYTRALLSSVLPYRPDAPRQRIVLQGEVPSPFNPPSGCPFHTRCPVAMEECSGKRPVFQEVELAHWVACYLYEPGGKYSPSMISNAAMLPAVNS
jgi:oligopeptide/dipeptide ABC transporter ATP-binding protein